MTTFTDREQELIAQVLLANSHIDALTAALAAERGLSDALAAVLADLDYSLRSFMSSRRAHQISAVLARHRTARQSTGGTHD